MMDADRASPSGRTGPVTSTTAAPPRHGRRHRPRHQGPLMGQCVRWAAPAPAAPQPHAPRRSSSSGRRCTSTTTHACSCSSEPDGTAGPSDARAGPMLAPTETRSSGPAREAHHSAGSSTRCAGSRGCAGRVGATWSLPDGSRAPSSSSRCSPSACRGIGYLHPQWAHGLWQGELAVHGEAPPRPTSTPSTRRACTCSRSCAPPGATRWVLGSWSSWRSAPTTRAASTASSTATAADPAPARALVLRAAVEQRRVRPRRRGWRTGRRTA